MTACFVQRRRPPRGLNRFGLARLASLATLVAMLTVAGSARADAPEPVGDAKAALEAALRGDTEGLFSKLKSGCLDVDHRYPGGRTLLMAAATCREGDCLAVVERLVAAGADLEARDDLGATALAHAAHFGHQPIQQALMKRGANPNTRDQYGHTPLIITVLFWPTFTHVAAMLVSAGADPQLKTPGGDTAVSLARFVNAPNLTKLFAESPKRPPAPPARPTRIRKRLWPGCKSWTRPRSAVVAKPGPAPWEIQVRSLKPGDPADARTEAALRCDKRKLYELLGRQCVDVDQPSDFDRRLTLLVLVAQRQPFTKECRALLVSLVEAGAAVENDEESMSPLRLASERDDWQMVRFLLRAGARPDDKGEGHRTALFVAAAAGAAASVRELLAGGANPAHRDHQQRTAAEAAKAHLDKFPLIAALRIAESKPAAPRLAARKIAKRPLSAACLARRKLAEAEARKQADAAQAKTRERDREDAERAARADTERRAEAERRARASREAGAEAAREHAEARRARSEAERNAQAEADRKAKAEAAEEAKRADARRKDEAELKEACAKFEVRLDRMDVRKVPGGYDFKAYARVYNGARFALKVTVDWEAEGGCSARGQIRDQRVSGLAFGVPMGEGTCTVPAFSVSFRLGRCERD